MNEKEKFYQKDWFMYVMLIFITPVGLLFLWKNQNLKTKTKWIIAVVFSIWFIIVIATKEEINEAEGEKKKKKEEKKKKKKKKEKKKKKKNKKQEEKEKKEKKKQKEKETEEKKEREEKEAKKKKEQEEKPEYKIKEALNDVSLVESINVKGNFEEPLAIQVEFLAKDNLTKNMAVSGIKIALLDIVYAIKELDYEVENLGISAKLPLVDKYGNEENEYVIKSAFEKETINKLSDDKYMIDTDKLEIIADDWWVHPAISE